MKRNLMHFLLSALLCVGSLAAYAQNVKVRGQLVDAETGEPLIGASVVVEGTTQGSVTDIDGYFTQSAPANATIVFSYVGYHIDRKTPVAVSNVEAVFIDEKLGTQEFPEILKSTPGVYVTKDGGGYGDAKTRVRGFDTDNVAVMINGVPMNGMENQKVYWSNWASTSSRWVLMPRKEVPYLTLWVTTDTTNFFSPFLPV